MSTKRLIPSALQKFVQQQGARQSIVETIIAFAIKIVGAVLSFGFTILLARAYGAAGVGQYGLAITTLTITTVVALIGLDYVLIRGVAGDVNAGRRDLARGTINTVTKVVAMTSLVLAAFLTFVFVPLLGWKFGMAGDTSVLAAIAFGLVPFAMMRVVSSSLRSTGKVLLAQALDGPIPMALTIGAMGILFAVGRTSSVVVAGGVYVAALSVVVASGFLIYFRSIHDWPQSAHVPVRPLLSQGWPIFAVAVTGFAVDWFIIMTLASSHSAAAVGQFRTAWQITSLINLVVVAFDAVSGPRVAAAWRRGDIDHIGGMWRQAVLIILAMSLPAVAVLMLWPGPILGVFGQEFRAADGALRILLIGQLVNVVTGPVGSILIMTGRERWSFAYSAAATILAVILALVLTPRFGITGAAWTSALTICFRNICALVIATRTIGLRLWPKPSSEPLDRDQ